jgi:hypothetical protein
MLREPRLTPISRGDSIVGDHSLAQAILLEVVRYGGRPVPEYSGYSIELVEIEPRQWASTIQRLDGRHIKSPVTGQAVAIWECSHAAPSAAVALGEAQAVIDAGIQVADPEPS